MEKLPDWAMAYSSSNSYALFEGGSCIWALSELRKQALDCAAQHIKTPFY